MLSRWVERWVEKEVVEQRMCMTRGFMEVDGWQGGGWLVER